MINLLPKIEKEFLRKGLKLRFVTVASLLIAATFLVGLVMLLPAYFLASDLFSRDATGGSLLESKDDSSAKKILNLPAEINSKLSIFQTSVNDVSTSDYFSKIVSFLPEGVRLSSLSLSKNQNYKGKNGTTILIVGTAVNRDALVSFSTFLKESDLFLTVEVPVSSLTKDKNLPFSINIFVAN